MNGVNLLIERRFVLCYFDGFAYETVKPTSQFGKHFKITRINWVGGDNLVLINS